MPALLAFAPTQRGAATGTLTFIEGTNTQTVALSGFGWAPPSDGLSATSLSFGGIEAGQFSPAQPITLSNTGDLPLTGIAVTVSGPFTESDNCNGQLAANYPLATCTISVQFVPNAGQLGAADRNADSDRCYRGRTQTVSLRARGWRRRDQLQPRGRIDFYHANGGRGQLALTLTVTNNGGAPMGNLSFTIPGSTVPGSPASYFTIGATTCPTAGGSTLAAGSSCTVQVGFNPLASGGSTASLAISSSNATAVSVPLSVLGRRLRGSTSVHRN